MAEWEPWRALRERAHLILRWARLPAGVDGTWRPHGDGTATITLGSHLERRARRAALTHELVHDERGIAYDEDSPPALVQREEETVERISASRLVPLDELADYVARAVELGEGVTAAMVSEEFDVPADVARRALRLLAMQRTAAAHPVWRLADCAPGAPLRDGTRAERARTSLGRADGGASTTRVQGSGRP